MDNSLSTLTTLARNWWAFILRGVIAIGFGLIAWFWPDLALNTLIWLFAFFAFFTGILAITAAVRAISQRERWLGLAAEGVIGIGAGVIAIVWPDLTAKTFLYILAAWAIVTGVLSISSAVRLRREISGEWALGLSGVALILFGIIAFARPKSGALAVLWLIGLSAIVFGILWVILGLELRRLRGTIDRLAGSAPATTGGGSAPATAASASQARSTSSQGITASPTSTSTATTAAAPAAASAAIASMPGKSADGAGPAGAVVSDDANPTPSSTEDTISGGSMPPTASAAATVEERTVPEEIVTGDEAAKVVRNSSSEVDAKAAESAVGDESPAAESMAAPTDSAIDSSLSVESAADQAATQEPAAEALASDTVRSMDASESGDEALDVPRAPSEPQAMTSSGAQSEAEATAGTGPASPVATAGEEFEEAVIVVGSSSGMGDDGLNGAGDATSGAATSGAAAMAAEMPRTTRRERALADLVAGLPPEGTGWVLGNGTLTNPEGYPLKGNASSRIYHAPGGQSYDVTIAEICFATADDARSAGFRPRQGDPGAEDAEPYAVESSSLATTDESGVVDVAPTFQADEATAGSATESTARDIPSEFVSHLVGTASVESSDSDVASESVEDDAIGNGSTEPAVDVAPLGIAAIDSDTVDEAEQATESRPSLSRSEQALQELIATLPPEGAGWVRGANVYTTPPGFPIKGNASSRIYHLPGGQNYQATIPEICFATVDDARASGFRPRHGDPAEADWSLVEETPEGVAMSIGHSDVIGATGTSRDNLQLQEIIAGLPPEGSGWVRGTGVYTTPYGYPIKGNASSRIYHIPGGQNYQATIPEICFASVDAARAGGFRPRHGDPAVPNWSLVEVTPGTEPVRISAEPSAADIDPDVAAILEALPSNGSGWRLGDGSPDCPASHPIKGNSSSRIYHVEEGRSYKATIPEFCFATENDAIAAGFRRARA